MMRNKDAAVVAGDEKVGVHTECVTVSKNSWTEHSRTEPNAPLIHRLD